MLIPPKSIASLVSVSSGKYVISESATDQQKKEFAKWLLDIKQSKDRSKFVIVDL